MAPPTDLADPNAGRKRPRWLLPAVALIALVIAGAIGFSILRGTSGQGTGAASPEEAMERFVASLESGDALGTIEVINPDETRPFIRIAEEASGLPDRLGVDQFVPDDDASVEFEVEREGVTFDTTDLSEGIAKVTLTGGTFTARGRSIETEADDEVSAESLLYFPLEWVGAAVLDTDPDELFEEAVDNDVDGVDAVDNVDPVDDESADGDEPEDDFSETEFSVDEWAEGLGHDVFMMAVERNGRWYLSPAYTIAETIRLQAGMPRADLGNAAIAVGADSPEEAAEELLVEALAFEVENAVGLLDPTTLAPLHDYIESFMSEVSNEDLSTEAQDFDARVIDFRADSEDLGDGLHRVSLRNLDLSFDDNFGDPVRLSFDGECLLTESLNDGSSERCLNALTEEASTPEALSAAELVPDEIFVVVRQVDDGYFVDPLETLAQYFIDFAEVLDDEVLEGFGIKEPIRAVLDEPIETSFTSGRQVERFVVRTDGLPIAVLIDNADDGTRLSAKVAVNGTIESQNIETGEQLARASLEPSEFAVVELRPSDRNEDFQLNLGPLDASYTVTFLTIPDNADSADRESVTEGTLAAGEVRIIDVDAAPDDLYQLDGEAVAVVVYQPDRFSRTGFAEFGTRFDDRGEYRVFQDGAHRLVLIGVSDEASYQVTSVAASGEPEIVLPVPDPIPLDSEIRALPPFGVVDRFEITPFGQARYPLPSGVSLSVVVNTEPGSEDLDLVLSIIDVESGEAIDGVDFNFSGEPEAITIEVPPGAEYDLVVSGFLGGAGSAQLEVEPQ